MTVLLLIAIHLGVLRGKISPQKKHELLSEFLKLPHWIRKALELNDSIEALTQKFFQKRHFLYLGRNLNYPIALEGALKLKEISYIHAEGYPAGEMKHGPIALIDSQMPLVALITQSSVYEKTFSNIEEAKARGATIIAVASKGDKSVHNIADYLIEMPSVPEVFSPIVNVVPLQFFAYYTALLPGCDVDQPRNLAKSVTVE